MLCARRNGKKYQHLKNQHTTMETPYKVMDVGSILENGYMDTRALFMYTYQEFPSITYITQVHTEKILEYIKEEYAKDILKICQYSEYDKKKRALEVDNTILFLSNKRIIRLVNNYCEMLHTNEQGASAEAFMQEINKFKRQERKK